MILPYLRHPLNQGGAPSRGVHITYTAGGIENKPYIYIPIEPELPRYIYTQTSFQIFKSYIRAYTTGASTGLKYSRLITHMGLHHNTKICAT